MIIDPNGVVLTKIGSFDKANDTIGLVVAGDNYEIGFAELEMAIVETVRNGMPLDLHRKQRLWNPY